MSNSYGYFETKKKVILLYWKIIEKTNECINDKIVNTIDSNY